MIMKIMMIRTIIWFTMKEVDGKKKTRNFFKYPNNLGEWALLFRLLLIIIMESPLDDNLVIFYMK